MKNLANKTIAIAATALCLGAGLRAFADSAGDVWSIMPCDEFGVTTNRFECTVNTSSGGGVEVSNPIGVKETLYFRMRLWNHCKTDTTGTPYYLPWMPTYASDKYRTTDNTTQTNHWNTYRPRVAIFPAGSDSPVWAELKEVYNSSSKVGEMFTDLVFEYVVQPGDYGLPVDIGVSKDGNPVPAYSGGGTSYYFDPAREEVWTFKPWDWKNDQFDSDSIVWTGGVPTGTTYLPAGVFLNTYTQAEQNIESSHEATNGKGTGAKFGDQTGFYVQTVKFGGKDSDGNVTTDRNAFSYSIPMYSTKSMGLLVAANTLTAERKFYLWSDNEAAFKVGAASGVEILKDVEVDPQDASVTRTVAVVTLTADNAPFALTGVNMNETGNLVLSATPHYNYRQGGALMSDFATIPVEITEPEPPSLDVTGAASLTATGERWTGTPLTVATTYELPSSAPNKLTVTLTPSVEGGDWKDYVFFHDKETYSGATPPASGVTSDTLLSGVINQGSRTLAYDNGTAKTIYVFPLKSDAQNTVLTLTPSYTGDDDNFLEGGTKEYTAKIKSLATAELAVEISPTKNLAAEIQVAVTDAYADEQQGSGYTLMVKTDADETDESAVTFTDVYLRDGILYTDVSTTPYTLPKVTFENELQTNSAIRVISPIGKFDTGWVEFTHDVKSKDVVAYVLEEGARKYSASVAQGTNLTVYVANPAYKNGDLYAFLVSADVESSWFDGATWVKGSDYTDGAGFKISQGTTLNEMTLTPLAPFSATFQVVLCTTETYSEDAIYTAFPASSFSLTVTNVAAKLLTNEGSEVGAMWMYLTRDEIEEQPEDRDEDGDGKFSEPVLYGQSRAFRIFVNDTSYDKANGMVVKWTVRKYGATKDERVRVTKPDDSVETTSAFYHISTSINDTVDTAAGMFVPTLVAATNYVIRAEVWDAHDYPGRNRETYSPGASVEKIVQVKGLSQVKVTTSFTNADGDNILYENTTTTPEITVALGDGSEWTDEIPVTVELAVTPKDANAGALLFSSDDIYETRDGANIYRHTFRPGSYEPWVLDVDVETLDGVAKSATATKGYDVVATVITTDELESRQMAANEYYLSGKLAKTIRIVNVAPVPDSLMPIGTENNSYTNLSQGQTIDWGVTDVTADLNAAWTNKLYGGAKADGDGNYPSGTGILVVVSGENVAVTNFFANGATYGQYEPQFIDDQYSATVYFQFYDKDGLGSTKVGPYIFPVAPTKRLTTVANMPSGGSAFSNISSKYATARGTGYGHTWVSGGGDKFISAENFYLSWNCGVGRTRETVYAFGYQVDDIDNGDLSVVEDEPYDVWLTRTGAHKRNAPRPAAYYEYSDGMYDSFLYAWIYAEEPGDNEGVVATAVQMGTNETAIAKLMKTFSLPTELNDDGSYTETIVEAVFSREYDIYDQMGDINNDGIPDYYMLFPNWVGGALAEADGSGSELTAINGKNDDDDYYPASSHSGSTTIIPGAVGGWSTSGQPFTAAREIRGYHDGLNFGMFQYDRAERETYGWISDIHMSTLEKKALLSYALKRRAALVKKLYTTGALDNSKPLQEQDELDAINAMLSHIYYTGDAVRATGDLNDRLFFPAAEYVTNNVSSGIERVVVNDDTGTNDTFQVDAWIRTFTPYGETEPVAFTNYTGDVSYTNEITGDVTTLLPYELYTVDQADLDNWLDKENNSEKYADQQATAKAFITFTWRNFASYGTWGWTCENRTDPTTDDTDGDGMPDGYEYYMWYSAMVGDGTEQLVGSKFNLSDIEDYDTVITSDDIASLYNPNIAGAWTNRDTDNDGIYDMEEFLIGSSPVHWDTDRDGLSDLYEVMYNLNPLSAAPGQNGTANGDGDFMAFYKVPAGDAGGLGAFEYIYKSIDDGSYWALDTLYSGYISTNKEYLTVTGRGVPVVPFNGGFTVPTEDTANYVARNAKVFTSSAPLKFDTKTAIKHNTVSLYHHQVHNYLGWDPRTAWHANSNGTVSNTDRWIEDGGPLPGGTPKNTAAYSAINEFLVLKYRYIVGLRNLTKDLEDLGKTTRSSSSARVIDRGTYDHKPYLYEIILGGTTNPSADYESTTWGDDPVTYAKAQHGADTDGDAVPDGWELYIGVNPNKDWRIPKGSPGYDELYHDGTKVWLKPCADYEDGLGLAAEYAGTDPCGVYPGCDTIYANHPSQSGSVISGWFNKILPTDPRNDDTDGDCIADGTEGSASWGEAFTFGRWGQSASLSGRAVKHFGIYGNNSDAGTRCIAGGGLNPCTIDTDEDGLPDPWERQYAGILFINEKVATKADGYEVFADDNIPSEELYDDIAAAVRARVDIEKAGFHVMMGMDPTRADATTPLGYGVSDRDWDGDGLQNWQEYMVQAMRHLRYDDARTPLLGRDCPAFSYSTGRFEPGQFNGEDKGFLRVSYTTPYTSSEAARGGILEQAGYPNFAAFVRQHPDYLKILGYFSDPAMEWDHARIDLQNKYMLPPSRITDSVLASGQTQQATDRFGNLLWQYDGSSETYAGNPTRTSDDEYYAPYVITNGEEVTVWNIRVEPVMEIVQTTMPISTILPADHTVALSYVGTDPRLWDTDGDGMDDYYELFHGLNPLLGSVGTTSAYVSKDVIALNNPVIVRGVRMSAWHNTWVGMDNETVPESDPMKYPWMMGTRECDADGDGLNNYEESLLANITSPNSAHTDPTPLWMTDATHPQSVFATTRVVAQTNYLETITGDPIYRFENGSIVRAYSNVVTRVYTNATAAICTTPSYTALYYPNEITSAVTVSVDDDGVVTATTLGGLAESWQAYGYSYLASFEENEGYDSDNDWRTDSGELKSLSRKNSDPLDFNDPAHRQSVWFGGSDEPGAAISYERTYRNMNGADFFRQFTVEAWIKPEAATSGAEQYIVSRASYYGPWDLYSWEEYGASSNAVIRMNFALGIDEAGNVFGEFENATEIRSRVTGEQVYDGQWVHVALTYDGTQLKLYRNGVLETTADTTLIPANGVYSLMQNPQSTSYFPVDTYSVTPSVTILGARAAGPGAFGASEAAAAASWDEVATDFYKGRVAEVRTWDGARTAAQLAADYNKTYSVDDVKAMRVETYAAWRDGARRNDNSGRDIMPAELIQYYNMATLPGATDASYVRTEPGGFVTNVLSTVRRPDSEKPLYTDLLRVGWWGAIQDSPLANTTYTSVHVVPWMENMVGHLPKLCGAVADSVFWSEVFAGYTSAGYHTLDQYTIANTLNPYNVAVLNNEDEYLYNKLVNLGGGVIETGITTNTTLAASHLLMNIFDRRMGFNGTTDLVPLGSAFAKRSEDCWDGQGAETAWQETGTDANANDLPDWWEQRYGLAADATADTEVTRNGVAMSAYEAYIRDLAAGMLPSGATDTAYLNREDFDNNGLPDWWTELYGVKGAAPDDDDNDGLSNYTEFLLSEYFDLGVTFSPVKPKSVSRFDSDYFFRIGQLYAGEIFTDHDFIEDGWEDTQGADYANRYSWDATMDNDEDGWSNYAERRFCQFTTAIRAPSVSHLLVDADTKDMPIPTLKLTLRYNGDQPLSHTEGESDAGGDSSEYDNQVVNELSGIVVQTFTRQGIIVPDATYRLTPGVDALRYFDLGVAGATLRQGTLAPGHIKEGDIELQVLQTANSRVYRWSIYGIRINRGTYEQYLVDRNLYGTANVWLIEYSPSWTTVDGFSVVQSGDSSSANLTLNGETIGTLDMHTGAFALDVSKLNGASDSDGNEIDVEIAQFQFHYISRIPTLQGNKVELYLGEANTGFVKEGANTIVAFYDLDGDGRYTYGEPMGTTVADVGWRQGEAEIELTDVSPIISRANLLDGYTDRATLYGTEHGDVTNLTAGTLSGGKYERVRVIRTQVNGWGIQTLGMENRVIFDKEINLDQRSYFYEGDVLEYGGFDIDWYDFQTEVMGNRNVTSGKIDPTSVTYRVVLGNGTIDTGVENNLYSTAVVRHFDAADARTRPVTQAPGSQASAVFGSRPVFKWTMTNVNPSDGSVVNNNSYTAFKVQVRDGSTVVYDSGVRRAPARDLQGVYTFVPDVYAGDLLEPGKNYKWFVTMYNSKFRSDYWSDDENNTFRMNPLTDNFGKIDVAVRYFGPSSVFGAGAVRVEAFTTPDFTGSPVARTTITDRSAIQTSDTEHVANATLVGLDPGTYYVRAYVDLNAYGTSRTKDTWESWGYVCKRDASDEDIYTPTTIEVGMNGASTVFDLYIEDVDTNGNCLPDAWEIVQNGGTLDNGTENINDTLDAGIEINQSITENLQNQQLGVPGDGSLSAYVFSVMSNSGVAALILNADTQTHSDYTIAAASAVGSISTVAVTTNLNVTAIGVSDESVTLSISGRANVTRTATTSTGHTLLGSNAMIYTSTGSSDDTAMVMGKVQYKLNLTDANWTDTDIRVPLTVREDGTFESGEFSVPKPSADAKQCFYRVVPLN